MDPKDPSKPTIRHHILDEYVLQVTRYLLGIPPFLRDEPGGYLTLTRLNPDGSEKQLARSSEVESARSWLKAHLQEAAQPGEVRYRLRLWRAGGRSASGIVFKVHYDEPRAAPPRPNPARSVPAIHEFGPPSTEHLQEQLDQLREDAAERARRMQSEIDDLKDEMASRLNELETLAGRLLSLEAQHEELRDGVVDLCKAIA